MIAGIITLGYLILGTVVLYLYITKPKVLSAERLEGHIPDPRDTEIVFLRERVVHLEAMLHGTARADTNTMAQLLRDHLLGTPTGLAGTTDDAVDGEDGGPDLGGYDEADWTDDYVVVPTDTGLIPPPPVEFPTP